MIAITHFDPSFATSLPETCSLLKSAGLVVHPLVAQITLHGSRGLARSHHPGSDIDLSLLVPFSTPPAINEELGNRLREVIDVTLSHWRATVEVDLAANFPLHPCHLACFQRTTYDPALCSLGGTDCFGIYKTQKGFSGFVLDAGIQVERMYPLITVWRKSEQNES